MTATATRTGAVLTALVTGAVGLGVLTTQGSSAAPKDLLHPALPLAFEANHGQAPADVSYLAHGSTYSVGLGTGTARLAAGGEQIALVPVDGALGVPHAVGSLPGRVSYLRGQDPAAWLRDVPTTADVRYRDVWDGVDLDFHGTAGALEFDATVAPGADVSSVQLRFSGASLSLTPGGDLVVATPKGPLTLTAPVASQGSRRVSSRFTVSGDVVGFAVGPYDHRRGLLIDPSVAFSTYAGGKYSVATGVGSDASSNIYVAGNASQGDDLATSTGTVRPTEGSDQYGDAYVEKLNPSGTAVLWATYIGGNASDTVYGLSVDSSGNTYLGGYTSSTDFPTTSGSYQPTFGGGVYSDGYLLKLNASGSSIGYATYIGGSQQDAVYGVAVAPGGGLSFTGLFPGGGPCAGLATGQLNAAGSALSWFTCGDGAVGHGVAVDAAGNTYVAGLAQSQMSATSGTAQPTFSAPQYGNNSFAEKLSTTGGLTWRTFLGGGTSDSAEALALDPSGNVYVTGVVNAGGFPTTTGALQTTSGGGNDAYALKLKADGTQVLYATYLSGTGTDHGYGIAADSAGHAYVTGTGTSGLPTTVDGAEPTAIANGDAFLDELAADGRSLVYGTFLGGSGQDTGHAASMVANGNVVFAGDSGGGFPVTQGAAVTSQAYGSFVAEIGAPVSGGGGGLQSGSPTTGAPGSSNPSGAPGSPIQPTAPALVTTVHTSDGQTITITTGDGQAGYADLDRHLLGGLSGDDMARLLRNGGFSIQIPLTYPAYPGSYSASGTASSSGVPGYDSQSVFSSDLRMAPHVSKAKTVTVFNYKHTFTKAKSYKVTIKLTKDGKKLLKAANKAHKKLKLSIAYTLKAKGHKTISRKLSTTLKPGKAI